MSSDPPSSSDNVGDPPINSDSAAHSHPSSQSNVASPDAVTTNAAAPDAVQQNGVSSDGLAGDGVAGDPSPSWTLGYCTNIHPGVDLDSILDNLARHSGAVRRRLRTATDVSNGQSATHPTTAIDRLGVGLWIPASAATDIGDTVGSPGIDRLAETMDRCGLIPYTINGFPYDNFHTPVVKHRVYRPDWTTDDRAEYTLRLARILAALISEGSVGSISTLPIAWRGGDPGSDRDVIDAAGRQLRRVADRLSEIESETGRRITVAIEPEPGCLIDHSRHVVDWFDREFYRPVDRRHLSVCHDVCHAAVMNQSQRDVLKDYADAEIEVGKVQVSSGIRVDFDAMATPRRHEAIEQLAGFAEDRYLHQTGRTAADGAFQLVEDLPQLIKAARSVDRNTDPVGDDARWTIHFHVPIFLERFGHLATTTDAIGECLRAIRGPAAPTFTGHVEVETYAWGVLPASMRRRDVVEEIADEMRHLQRLLKQPINAR